MSAVPAVRTLVVWIHDWPVIAADVALDVPAIILDRSQVVACSPAARDFGVRVGQRRREAQARCPELEMIEHDPARDAREFEPVVAALEATITPRIELTVPGRCAFATRGPSRYFGGDASLAERVTAVVAEALNGRPSKVEFRVAIADGPWAATLAARQSWPGATHREAPQRPASGMSTDAAAPIIVAPGASASRAFLAPLPVSVLDVPDLVGVLDRLGIRTLGAFAELPTSHVVGRFGVEGERAHQLARGHDGRPPAARPAPLDLTFTADLDEPIDTIDPIAFKAKELADDLDEQLANRGLACTSLVVRVETEHGEHLERMWRNDGPFTPAAMVDRVRWQLEGWLRGTAAHRPTAGIVLLRLAADEVVPATGRQLGFWGEATDADRRVARAVARIEGLLGPQAVTVFERRGGRGPGDQVVRVPVSATDLFGASHRQTPAPKRTSGRDRSTARPGPDDGAPWPGRLPPPSPASVPAELRPVEVVDERGTPVSVTGRGLISADPTRLSLTAPGNAGSSNAGSSSNNHWIDIVAWAGPWTFEERWWVPQGESRRRARVQVVTADGAAYLIAFEKQRRWLEATYD